MFLFALGTSLTLGTALFAVASFSDGALVATRTVAQVIGWLFVLASVAGAAALRREQEGVRLEYCESRASDETTCPSPIPQSHPG